MTDTPRPGSGAIPPSPPQPSSRAILLLGAGLLLLLGFSLFVGRYPAPYIMPPELLRSDEMAWRLVWGLRLPRLVAAVLVGMALAAAGTVFQTIFANPLVEPGFLGVSPGAAFGAAFCIVFLGNQAFLVQGFAAFFAVSGLLISYALATRMRFGGWLLRLVLAGIAVSALFSSALGVLKYLADPLSQLPEITFWLLGGLWSITWDRLLPILPVVLGSLTVMLLMRWRLNALGLDDTTAFSLGLAPARERALLLFAAVAATAAVVSVAGMIGWVGLIVPHLARRCFGADCRQTMPAAMLMGGVLVVGCDDVARCAMAGEIPLGILTSLVGAGGFMVLMTSGALHRTK
ncbi:MAG TPA: iron ABC transporter permease [Candidatus Ozemobacteraceae bacterium]|nr:iron ABC transporter permease [Candidatus Ozemobacteraceae bacterium]